MIRHAFLLALVLALLDAGAASAQVAPNPQVATPLPPTADAGGSTGPAFSPTATPPGGQPPPQPVQPTPAQLVPAQVMPVQPLPPSVMPYNTPPPQPLWQPSPYGPVTPPPAASSLQPEGGSPKPETSDDSSPFGGRGMGGMPFGMGADAGMPGYKVLWMPDQPVTNQAAHLGMEQQDLSLRVPIWKDGPDRVMFSTRVRWEIFQTDAILPDTRQPFPTDLWQVSFGASYFHQFDNGYLGGASVNFGSASDQPFHSFQEDVASVNGFLRVPQGEHNAWLFTLMFSTNGQLSDIPIPGVAYFYAPSDVFQATIGFPFATLKYHPAENWRFELSYALITTIHARAIYQPAKWLDCYAGFDWLNESYLLVDRPEEKDRFFYYEMRVSAGLKFKLREHVTLDFSAGYAFDRYYYEGTSFSLTGGTDRVDVGAGPFVAGQLQARF